MIQRTTSTPSPLRRALWAGATSLLAVSIAVAAGCSSDPEPGTTTTSGGTTGAGGTTASGGTTTASGGTTTAMGGAAGGGSTTVPACVNEALVASCNVCHSPGTAAAFGGFITSENLLANTVDKPATYMAVVKNPTACVPGAKIIDTANPENSVLLKKIMGTQACGDTMPQIGVLTQAHKDCLAAWIRTF